jgi:long-chain acyl-CoA synthetase
MGYNASDKPHPRGEIWVRGPNVFMGYFKDEAKTKETLTDDGWLQMGDIGYVDEKGRIVIIDRKKNIFKLAQGEYVAPEKVENTYLKSPLVAQIFVHGDSLQSELVAVVALDGEHAIPFAKKNNLLPASVADPGPTMPGAPMNPALIELGSNATFKELLLKELDVWGKKDKLRGFEFVKGVHIASEFFTGENGLLTPTFKLKRNEAAVSFFFFFFFYSRVFKWFNLDSIFIFFIDPLPSRNRRDVQGDHRQEASSKQALKKQCLVNVEPPNIL